MASTGWKAEWTAIEERHNSAAHELATAARKKAQRLADAGHRTGVAETSWSNPNWGSTLPCPPGAF
eukprot:12439595-Heterocapsa_arctica.AAC.1